MDTTRIRELVRDRSDEEPRSLGLDELADLKEFLVSKDVTEYLRFCLPFRIYGASEVRVLDLSSINEEMCEGAAPGGFIRLYGYLVIASDVGGNAIVVHHSTGRVFWVDHESFSADQIAYKDRTTTRWKYLYEYTPQNVETACVLLSEDFERFLMDLLSDRLTDKLDQLD